MRITKGAALSDYWNDMSRDMNQYIPLSLMAVVITHHVILHVRIIDDYCYEMLYQVLITLLNSCTKIRFVVIFYAVSYTHLTLPTIYSV